MGLLSKGEPLDWPETLAIAQIVKDSGVRQFCRLYREHKNRQNDPFLWGDEIEYIVVRHIRSKEMTPSMLSETLHKDQNGKSALDGISGRAECTGDCRVAVVLNAEARLLPLLISQDKSKIGRWHVEQSGFMLESTPYQPYSGIDPSSICSVERNMRARRQHIQGILDHDEMVVTMGNFPRLGCHDAMIFRLGAERTAEPNDSDDQVRNLFTNRQIKSIYLPDGVYASHPRFM